MSGLALPKPSFSAGPSGSGSGSINPSSLSNNNNNHGSNGSVNRKGKDKDDGSDHEDTDMAMRVKAPQKALVNVPEITVVEGLVPTLQWVSSLSYSFLGSRFRLSLFWIRCGGCGIWVIRGGMV